MGAQGAAEESGERAVEERLARVRLVALDVDGVLTDGRIIVDHAGLESKEFYVRDGVAIALLERAGIATAILSGRTSAPVAHRALELRMTECVQGRPDKVAALDEILARLGIRREECAFMGDDVVDVPLLRSVGLAAAPADAHPEARAAAHLVTRAAGGRGCVRELGEAILRAKGVWDTLLREAYG